MLLRSTRFALALIALTPAAAARAASLWTPLPTGTTDTISAVAWPTASTLVFATTAGHVFRETSPDVFGQSTVSPGAPLGFTDIAMSADGTKGVAVGPSGALYDSTDSGATWSADPAPTDYGRCGLTYTPAPLIDDLYSARFADASTVYVTGNNTDILRSTDGGAHFTEINKSLSGGNVACKLDPNEPLSDSAWLDANHGFFMSEWFGDLYATVDGLATPITSHKSEALDSYMTPARMALDTADPTRMWAVAGYPSCGTLCFVGSTDGGSSWNPVTYDGHQVALHDISNSGTTVVAVGDGGDIYTSPDGSKFYRQVADAPYSANNWRAVAVLNSTTAVVGGANGVLLATTKANQTPDTIPPTGTISGPATLAPGQFGSYTATAADNAGGSGIDAASFVWTIPGQANQTGPTAKFAFPAAGTYTVTVSFKDLAGNSGSATITIKVSAPPPSGSNPVTKQSGGATVTIFKKVTVSHRNGRYIPVVLSTKKPRRFIVTLLTKKGNHQLATLTTTLKKGRKTVHLRISSKVKSGTYKLIVIVLTTGKHSHPVGAKIKQVFVLA
jgi:photosystem II stability/assembly factor-like uncharacterized protein